MVFLETVGDVLEEDQPKDDVLVERGGVELCEDKDFVDVRVQTIADRDVYDPVFAGKGHRGLAALLR